MAKSINKAIIDDYKSKKWNKPQGRIEKPLASPPKPQPSKIKQTRQEQTPANKPPVKDKWDWSLINHVVSNLNVPCRKVVLAQLAPTKKNDDDIVEAELVKDWDWIKPPMPKRRKKPSRLPFTLLVLASPFIAIFISILFGIILN